MNTCMNELTPQIVGRRYTLLESVETQSEKRLRRLGIDEKVGRYQFRKRLYEPPLYLEQPIL